MRLTPILIGFLNRVFNKSPKQFLAFTLDYRGPMVWAIADQVLTTTVQGGAGVSLSVDLTQYTLAALVAFLAAQTGYTSTLGAGANGALSACVLIDGTNSPALPNGDLIYGYGSILWALMDAAAVELQTAEAQVAAAPLMMQTTTGQGFWLDVLGALFGVQRGIGELDPSYGPRIITQTLRPCSNNFAIAITLEASIGYPCDVIDSAADAPSLQYNGLINWVGDPYYFDSTADALYGVFDVFVHTGASLSATQFAAVVVKIQAILGSMRAGGTFVRVIGQVV